MTTSEQGKKVDISRFLLLVLERAGAERWQNVCIPVQVLAKMTGANKMALEHFLREENYLFHRKMGMIRFSPDWTYGEIVEALQKPPLLSDGPAREEKSEVFQFWKRAAFKPKRGSKRVRGL